METNGDVFYKEPSSKDYYGLGEVVNASVLLKGTVRLPCKVRIGEIQDVASAVNARTGIDIVFVGAINRLCEVFAPTNQMKAKSMNVESLSWFIRGINAGSD